MLENFIQTMYADAYLEPNLASTIEFFFQKKTLSILAKSFNMDVWLGSKYTSGIDKSFSQFFNFICL